MIKQSKRILIVGSPGSGKTTFSVHLGKALQIPVFLLDDYYWLEGWQRVDPNQWKLILQQLCSKPSWIIDGNHLNTLEQRLPYADLVILLNCSVFICFWRFFKRSIKRFFNKDGHLPRNIKESELYKPKISIQWHIIKLILFYKLLTKPKIMKLIQKHSLTILILPTHIGFQKTINKIADNT